MWKPAHADHSIVSVQVFVTFTDVIEPEDFDDLVVAARKLGQPHGLTRRSEMHETLDLSGTGPMDVKAGLPSIVLFGPGQVSNQQVRRRVVFQEVAEDQVIKELHLGATSIFISSNRYRRWADFFTMIQDFFAVIESIWSASSKVKLVRLQYVDRFASFNEGAKMFDVIDKESRFLTSTINDDHQAFHVHSGWFDQESEHIRRLSNVNIDAQQIHSPEQKEGNQVSILTLGQFEATSGALDDPLKRLGDLHIYLKGLYGSVVTREMADLVSLNPVS
jgi:uncharacterized protein (TIGR04255 family)